LIKRLSKSTKIFKVDPDTAQESEQEVSVNMWGLFALEDIPAGAFIMEYRGEIVTKKHGDMRGTFYDSKCLSYLFDMNDLELSDKREQQIQQAYNNEFFPLCLDAMFYGNEARFINHSCDPNVQSFNLAGQANSQVIHNIGLFASRNIKKGEELNLDYQWDKNELAIKENVPCLCGSHKCRGFLMRARKPKPPALSRESSVQTNQTGQPSAAQE
jgi:SET domain-containing protein